MFVCHRARPCGLMTSLILKIILIMKTLVWCDRLSLTLLLRTPKFYRKKINWTIYSGVYMTSVIPIFLQNHIYLNMSKSSLFLSVVESIMLNKTKCMNTYYNDILHFDWPDGIFYKPNKQTVIPCGYHVKYCSNQNKFHSVNSKYFILIYFDV